MVVVAWVATCGRPTTGHGVRASLAGRGYKTRVKARSAESFDPALLLFRCLRYCLGSKCVGRLLNICEFSLLCVTDDLGNVEEDDEFLIRLDDTGQVLRVVGCDYR